MGNSLPLACSERNADKAIPYGFHDRKEPQALSMLLHSFNIKAKTSLQQFLEIYFVISNCNPQVFTHFSLCSSNIHTQRMCSLLRLQFTFCHVLNNATHDSKINSHLRNTLNIKIRPAIISGTTSASNPVLLPAVNKL